jgi:hypothetical protein
MIAKLRLAAPRARGLGQRFRKERLSTHLGAIDPTLSRRMMYASCSLQNCFASTTNDAIHRSICFVLRVDEAVGDGP